MQVITYNTGRTYDTAQVLCITVEAQSTETFGYDDITDFQATFTDASRGVSGRVTGVAFKGEFGPAVLAEYDAGRYEVL